jgi:hypothetical protein
MGYGQRPGNTGHRGNWRQPAVRSLPQCRYGRRHGPRGCRRACPDQRGHVTGGDRGCRPPRWRYGRRRYEQWNQQRGYAPRQYPQLLQLSQADLRADGPADGPRTGAVPRLLAPAVTGGAALIATVIAAAWGIQQRALSAMRAAGGRRPPRVA